MNTNSILVIGSTGKTGRRILKKLTDLGHDVRGGSRQSNPPFDWEQPSTWAKALKGMDSIYISYFPDLAVPGAPEAIFELTELAKKEGVKRLVLLSGRGEMHAQTCEGIVSDSGLDWTLIRASWFFQNFDEGHLLDPVLSGVLALPAGEVTEPFVDVEDIADVAVAALTESHHAGQLYEVTGPRLLSFQQVAEELSTATQRKVQYFPMASEDYRQAAAEEVGQEMADMLTDLMAEVLDGRNETLGTGVEEALGRKPREFAAYCAATAESGVWRN